MAQPLTATLRFVSHPAPRVIAASESILTLLGFTAAQFLDGSVDWVQRVHPDDLDITEQLFAAHLSPAQGSCNIRLRHQDGRIRCIKLDYRWNQPAAQPAVLELLLTDARSLHRRTPDLEMPNFLAVMENTDDFIFFKDRNHVFTGASQTLVGITNPSKHWTDLIGHTDYDLFPEAYADAYYRLEKQVFGGQQVAREVQSCLTNDGHTGWVDNRKYPITNAKGEIIGLFGVARDITELKLADAALRESEHRLRTIFEQLPAISVQGYDNDRRVIFWNQASETLYGYTREQAMGQRLEELIIPPPMRAAVIGLIDAWRQGGPAVPSAEWTLQDAQGAPVEVYSSHVMLKNNRGDSEMFCVDIGIGERKKAEHALRSSSTFLRTIIDQISDPLFLKDFDGNFLLCNQALAHLYKTTPEEMVGKSDADFGVPQEMADAFRKNVQDIMVKGDTQVVFEDSRDAATGVLRQYRSTKKPYKDANGQHQILVLTQEISDVMRPQHQVDETERRLQPVMGVTPEGSWDWHLPSGKVIHNRQWYEVLNYQPGEVADTVEAFTQLIHPDDLNSVRKCLEAVIKGDAPSYQSEHRLRRGDGKYVWVQDRGRVMDRDEQGHPVRIAGSFADVSFQKEHQTYLEHIAHYDPLTGLVNRVLLADRLHQAMAQARRRGTLVAVAYLDLDGFKAVNDQHGHATGDELLVRLAGQFKGILREGDTMARIGGDEFVAVFADLSDAHGSLALIQRLLDASSQPITIGELNLSVSASVGVSFYPQTEEASAEQLLRQADQAMYSAKLAGKNCYQLFNAEHDRNQRAHNETLERIQQALTEDEFVLYYQPKVNLRTGDVVGAEALIRWQHPQRGLLAPGAFLPAIEGHAISVNIGDWVLTTALAQMQTWADAGLQLPVSVNISAYQLQRPDFADKLRAQMGAHPLLPRDHLQLEVLETTALEELDSVAHVIRECTAMGIGCALDDFGTGYSSLTYLKRLPVQVLKIDQSFIRDMLVDPDDLAIVEGVLGLARAFKREAVAEGAETIAHCKKLLHIGCDLAQGYGIARPMPAGQMPAWVAHWLPDPDWLKQ